MTHLQMTRLPMTDGLRLESQSFPPALHVVVDVVLVNRLEGGANGHDRVENLFCPLVYRARLTKASLIA